MLYADSLSGNNLFYWNNFTYTEGYYIEDLNGSNQYNTSVNDVAQGNYYFNISSLRIYDTDTDGWGDAGTDYPLNSSTTSKWNGYGADYGPATIRIDAASSEIDKDKISSSAFQTSVQNTINFLNKNTIIAVMVLLIMIIILTISYYTNKSQIIDIETDHGIRKETLEKTIINISKIRGLGYSEGVIKQYMKRNGWTEEQITYLFSEYLKTRK